MKTCFLLIALFGFFWCRAQTTNWSPAQCLKLKNINAVVPSPDGKKVLYSVREALMTDDRSEYISQIWLCDANGSHHVQLTKGDKISSNPRWSPDGKWISFSSARDGKTNLYLLPYGGGEAEKITDAKTGVGNYEWSTDGRMIAFTMFDAADEKEEKNRKAKNDWYFMDEEIKQNRLYILWLNQKDSAGKYIQKKMTKENFNIGTFSWSNDGKYIAYGYGKSSKVNDMVYGDVGLLEVETGRMSPIAATRAGETNPRFSPDGSKIAYACTGDPLDWAGPNHIRIYSLNDKKTWPLKATPDENAGPLGWTADSKQVLVTEARQTFAAIYALAADGNGVQEWTSGIKQQMSNISLNHTNNYIGFVLQGSAELGEAYISTVSSFAPVKLTSVQAEHAHKPLPKTEVIRWAGADGKEIEGLLTYPLNYKAGQKVPLILNIHGGPAGVFQQSCVASNSGGYPLATLAELGYAILRPNPRGSTGYGAGFRMGNRADWGGKDYIDLMNGVDHAIKMGLADPARLGVMGWSYGGFMSSWIVGHTDRFKAASIGAPVVDLAHQNLTDDIAGFVPSYFQSEPWDNWSLYDAHSPLRFVQNVKTPVMLQHGEADQRVPFSNAVMFYNALKRRNVPVRLLVLPRQPHGPIEPRMVLKTMQSNVEWMGKYLGMANQ
jgi:dipeptidyl aminopeptidase/acylaminoacyl peptidase